MLASINFSCKKMKYNIEKENNNIKTMVNHRFVQMGKKIINNRQMRNVTIKKFSSKFSEEKIPFTKKYYYQIQALPAFCAIPQVFYYLVNDKEDKKKKKEKDIDRKKIMLMFKKNNELIATQTNEIKKNNCINLFSSDKINKNQLDQCMKDYPKFISEKKFLTKIEKKEQSKQTDKTQEKKPV